MHQTWKSLLCKNFSLQDKSRFGVLGCSTKFIPFHLGTLVEHLKDSNQVQAFYDECLLSGAETDSDKQAQLAAYLLVKIDQRSAQRGLCSKQRLSLSEP